MMEWHTKGSGKVQLGDNTLRVGPLPFRMRYKHGLGGWYIALWPQQLEYGGPATTGWKD